MKIKLKIIPFTFFIFMALTTINYKAQSVDFCRTLGGKNIDFLRCIVVSKNGNVYSSGLNLSDTMSLGSCSLTNGMGSTNAYISKTDSNGLCIWFNKLEAASASTVIINSPQIAIDSLENLYIISAFSGTVDVDPSNATSILSSLPNSENQFVAKYDPNGNLLWSFTIKDTSVYGHGPVTAFIDKDQNLLLTGTVESNADFDPSSSIQYLAPNLKLGYTTFLSKYSYTGSLIWAYPFLITGLSNTSAYIEVNDITVDNQNNIILIGRLFKAADFEINSSLIDTISLPTGGYFLAKYNTNANKIFAFGIDGGAPLAQGFYGTGVETDKQNNIYVSGVFRHYSVDFDPSPTNTYTLGTSGDGDGFFAKYTPSGSMLFTNKISGSYDDWFTLTDRDKLGNLYFIVWYLSPDFDIDFSVATNTISTLGSYDHAIVRTDSNGVPNTIIPLATIYYDNFVQTVKQFKGIIYAGGIYSGEIVDFDPTNAIVTPIHIGSVDGTITRYATRNQPNDPLSIHNYTMTDKVLEVYPNPTYNELFINSNSNINKIEIFNSVGMLLGTYRGDYFNKISLNALPPSIYILLLHSETQVVAKKIIKWK